MAHKRIARKGQSATAAMGSHGHPGKAGKPAKKADGMGTETKMHPHSGVIPSKHNPHSV